MIELLQVVELQQDQSAWARQNNKTMQDGCSVGRFISQRGQALGLTGAATYIYARLPTEIAIGLPSELLCINMDIGRQFAKGR